MQSRQSSIELLRIITMILIIITHCVVWGIFRTNNASISQQFIGLLTNDIIKWHVNVFIIITGFFGIKSKWSLLNIITISLFYTWILYAIQCTIIPNSFSTATIIKSFFFITHSKYWFIQTYILLFLLAPFINQLIKKEIYPSLIGVFLFIDCWCGYIHNDTISNGFGIIHFLTLYIIGRGLKLYNIDASKSKMILIFSIVTCLLIIQSLYLKHLTSGNGYNNPLLIINAVLIFLLFKKVNIQNTIINKLANSSLAIYLIHDSDVGHYYLLKITTYLNIHVSSPYTYIICIIAICILIYFICAFADKIISLIYTPFIHHLKNVLSKNRFLNKYENYITNKSNN